MRSFKQVVAVHSLFKLGFALCSVDPSWVDNWKLNLIMFGESLVIGVSDAERKPSAFEVQALEDAFDTRQKEKRHLEGVQIAMNTPEMVEPCFHMLEIAEEVLPVLRMSGGSPFRTMVVVGWSLETLLSALPVLMTGEIGFEQATQACAGNTPADESIIEEDQTYFPGTSACSRDSSLDQERIPECSGEEDRSRPLGPPSADERWLSSLKLLRHSYYSA